MLLSLLGGLYPQMGQAQTSRDEVSGTINADTTWTVLNSPYTLTGDVTVATGVTLTVEPGVVVKGSDNYELRIEGHLEATPPGYTECPGRNWKHEDGSGWWARIIPPWPPGTEPPDDCEERLALMKGDVAQAMDDL